MGFLSQEARVIERFRIIEVAQGESVVESHFRLDFTSKSDSRISRSTRL